MAPIIELSHKELKKLEAQSYTRRHDLEDWIYVPSLGLDVAKKVTDDFTDFFSCQNELHPQCKKMLSLLEFVKFKNYIESNHLEKDIRLGYEWIDASFKMINDEWNIFYHTFDLNGNICEKSEKLEKSTLLSREKDAYYGSIISMEDWLKNPTKQGLPKKSVKFFKHTENNSSAMIYKAPQGGDYDTIHNQELFDIAILDCLGSGRPHLMIGNNNPSSGVYNRIGARIVKQHNSDSSDSK
jgi:hypothetical protein